jgi:hypothetical protein
MSSFFNLNKADFWKAVVVAGIVAFLGALQQAVTGHGLDLASYDWGGILNITLMAAGGYLSKNFLSTSDGAFAGIEATRATVK